MEEKLPPISSGKRISPKDKSNDISEVSLDHSVLDLSALYKWLEEKKWEYCIWISKSDRDHNKNSIGQLDPDGIAFKKLIEGLGLTFPHRNGWETIIYNKDGLYFSWSINKNGYLRFWINDYLSWELFFKLLQEKLKICNLTSEELKEVIECLEDEEKKKLFYLETANLIGPRDIIEREFNKACLIFQKVYFNGLYMPVLIKIDKSKGPYEIELIGAEGPTRRLQDVTVRAFETVQSLGQMDFKLDSNLEISSANNELLHTIQEQITPKQEILSEFSELQAWQFKKDLQDELVVIEFRDYASRLAKMLNALSISDSKKTEYLKELSSAFISGVEDIKSDNREIIQEIEADIILGMNTLDKNISSSKTEIIDKVDQAHLDIKTEIKTGIKEVKENIQEVRNDIKELIDLKFSSFSTRIKNNLFLVVRKLENIPELTAKGLSKEINLSQKTMYSYLKLLQDKNLIKSKKKKSSKPGRPPRIFKSKIKK